MAQFIPHNISIFYLNVEGHQDPVEFLLHFLVDHDLPPRVLQLVDGRGLGDGPADDDAVAVELRLVGSLSNVEELDLHQSAGLAGPDELLVAVSSGGGPGCREEKDIS